MVKSVKILAAAALLAAALVSRPAEAGSLACTGWATCGWGMSVNDTLVAWGTLIVDADGNITGYNGNPTYTSPDGTISASLNSMSGNIDPEVVFGLGATNNSSAPVTYSFSFSLPITGLTAPIATESALSMTLTTGGSFPTVGHLFPTSGTGFVADSQDIRISPFSSVDKGVDIGLAFDDPAGGLATVTNDFKTGSILSGGPFNTMSVIVAFGLADDKQIGGLPGAVGVGISGRVKQTPIVAPEPTALLLIGASLAALAGVRRRSS